MDATLFKGGFPVEAVTQIKSIEDTHNTVLSDLKIMAPSKLFKIENADDPLLFAPMGNGYYYLIHQWGDDLHPFRKAMVWPFKNIITACISLLVSSFFLSFFVPMSLFTPNPTTSDFLLKLYRKSNPLRPRTIPSFLILRLWPPRSFLN